MEQEQFIQEVVPLRRQLLIYAKRFLGNQEDAEDVVQEVLLKLWYMRKDLAKYENIPALSMQITKHLCLNRLKVLSRKQEGLDEVLIKESEMLSPYTQLEQKDSVAQVMKIVDRLPELQQAILRMKHIDGFEIDEIAELTGSRTEAVRMNLSRARKKVKDLFLKIQNG
jgi:RNA polymerase sigma-70 factor (ECF subfamily)